MSELFATEHVAALAGIAIATAVLVAAARRSPGRWLVAFGAVLVIDEISWWVYVVRGGVPGSVLAWSLPLQLCDVAIFAAAAALWTRRQLLVEVTYFWGLAGTIQALLTPDLPQHFPMYPYWQYYIAHGGVVAAALVLVVGLRIHPRPRAVFGVAAITLAYAAVVAAVDAVTGADYMYLRAKPASPTLLDAMGPWPVYVVAASVIGAVLFAALDAPFRFARRKALRTAPRTQPR
ncbi:MAG TPA: TIGR02206 family membrane protein [Candidatus Dormibacteraeota bacterium]